MPKKILVVDDNSETRKVLKARLNEYGFEVLEAADGSLGFGVAKREKPDLVLLDIMMPGQNGIETYNALKKDLATKAIPVVFLTGLAQDSVPLQSSSNPQERYWVVGKPYQPEELLKTIKQALV